jgi:hypothetical protein
MGLGLAAVLLLFQGLFGHLNDVLLAEDHIGAGHKWRPIDDQPWRRAYAVLKPGAKDSFVPKRG